MARKYRPLRPIPDSSHSGSGSSSSLAVNSSLINKRKRVGVAVACDACRRRKIRCDGRLPACNECEQRSVECIYEPKTPHKESGSSESNTGSASRSNTGSNSTGSSGDGLIEAVQLLNKIPPQDTTTVLRSLKDITDASFILSHLRGRVTELERHPQVVTTELDSLSRTIDLENRYPSAYPILDPLDVCMQSSLFQQLAESGSYKFPSCSLPCVLSLHLERLLGLFYHQPGVEYPATPPNLPIPCKARRSDNAHRLDTTISDLSEYCDESFVLFCELWRKMHEVAIVYYNGEAGAISGRVPVQFAEDTFQGLMELMNRLPLVLTRNEDNPHHVVIFHLWLHAAILDIFRPFLEAVPDAHRPNHPRHSRTNADTIYAASVEQLKRLIIIYRSQYVSSGHTIIWHTAMLYVANAVLRSRGEGWLSYFLLCLYGYQSLWTSYPIVKPIARGLLSMAMRRGGISSDKARQILVDLGNNCPEALHHGEIRATFMLDLDLAMSDPNAAKAEAQAEAFEDTAMVVDYTNAFSSQEAVG
ncbi:hypothetical protein ARSEF1564_008462 [Beauveria bassiana]